MTYLYKGTMAGLFAAVVIAAVLQVNVEYGYLPELGFAALLGDLFGIGTAGGWILHFVLGATWGALFAWLDPDLPGDDLRQRGILFACVLWLAMMTLLMPLAGFGFFGFGYGILLPLAALGLHVVFGAVMGRAYAWLLEQGMPLRYGQEPPVTAAVRAEQTEQVARAEQSEPPVPTVEAPATASAAPAEVVPIETARSPQRRSGARNSSARRSKIGT